MSLLIVIRQAQVMMVKVKYLIMLRRKASRKFCIAIKNKISALLTWLDFSKLEDTKLKFNSEVLRTRHFTNCVIKRKREAAVETGCSCNLISQRLSFHGKAKEVIGIRLSHPRIQP